MCIAASCAPGVHCQAPAVPCNAGPGLSQHCSNGYNKYVGSLLHTHLLISKHHCAWAALTACRNASTVCRSTCCNGPRWELPSQQQQWWPSAAQTGAACAWACVLLRWYTSSCSRPVCASSSGHCHTNGLPGALHPAELTRLRSVHSQQQRQTHQLHPHSKMGQQEQQKQQQ